ncbi:acyl-CoA thioesterase [Nonomuraea sp. NPDC049269]|uniref:acyl-CoA thioesterase n=1 Tax=Nonomuraea sp. NPDC049269 TaxID=3364349 RepID=UPI00371C7116
MSGPRPLRRRVEHVDTDAAGVVHFTRYASLIETALLEDLEAMGVGTRLMSEHQLQPAVTELRMRYGAAARFPDRIEVRAGIDHVGGASWRVSGTVCRLPDHADTGPDHAGVGRDDADVWRDRADVWPDRTDAGVDRAGARAGMLLATGTLVMCLVNAADGTPAPLPAALRAALRAQLSEGRTDGRDR